jgi:hypothetical protein
MMNWLIPDYPDDYKQGKPVISFRINSHKRAAMGSTHQDPG